MQYPGQTMTGTLARFSPAIQPSHTRELVWILVELAAVTITRHAPPLAPTLFSRPVLIHTETASEMDDDDEVVVEAMVDAVERLGTFIGAKQYRQDFVCQCPCHPDRRM